MFLSVLLFLLLQTTQIHFITITNNIISSFTVSTDSYPITIKICEDYNYTIGEPTIWGTLIVGCDNIYPKNYIYLPLCKNESNIICSYNAYNCVDFSSQQEAQNVFEFCFEQTNSDIHDLDRNNDFIACEHLD